MDKHLDAIVQRVGVLRGIPLPGAFSRGIYLSKPLCPVPISGQLLGFISRHSFRSARGNEAFYLIDSRMLNNPPASRDRSWKIANRSPTRLNFHMRLDFDPQQKELLGFPYFSASGSSPSIWALSHSSLYQALQAFSESGQELVRPIEVVKKLPTCGYLIATRSEFY